MPIIDTPKCNLLYSKDAEAGLQPKAIKDDMLCAGFAEGKKDACKVGAGVGCARGRARLLTSRPGPGGGGASPAGTRRPLQAGPWVASQPSIPAVGNQTPGPHPGWMVGSGVQRGQKL